MNRNPAEQTITSMLHADQHTTLFSAADVRDGHILLVQEPFKLDNYWVAPRSRHEPPAAMTAIYAIACTGQKCSLCSKTSIKLLTF